MEELKEFLLKEQRITIRRALDAWVKTGGGHPFHILRKASLNGDTAWINDARHFWLGADLLWEDSTIGTRWIQKAFFHVFAELVDFENQRGRITDDRPPEMDGLRQSISLEDTAIYYQED